MILIVAYGGVTHHGHDIREYDARSVVFIGVDEDAKAVEFVYGAEDGTGGGALLGEPDGHAVAVEVSRTVNFELNFDLLGGDGSVIRR